MTERDSDEERWRLALDGLREVGAQYQQLLRNVQSGFSFLSDESAATARRLTRIEAKLHTLDETMQQLLPHMATIAAYAVRMRPTPQTKKSGAPRRVNGE